MPVTALIRGMFLLSVPTVWSFASLAEPFVPANDRVVLERLPTVDPQLGQKLQDKREALATNPSDLRLALSLARSYAALGRSEGDPRFDGYAQAALAPWWDLVEPPIPVLILRATLKQRRHDFEAALADLHLVLARSPRQPQALLMKATILGVQGKPERALDTCAQLWGAVDQLVAATCTAGAAGLGGSAREAYRMLEQVLARSAPLEAELRLWAHTIQAELAVQLGEIALAEAHFRKAIALDADDPYLLASYADFLLDQSRPAEVVELLHAATRIDPLLLRLALAEAQLNHPRLAKHVGMLEARVEAARRRGDAVHLREQAMFALYLQERPGDALRLALENFEVQREPLDARIVLEAALAADQPEAAAPVLAWLDDTGLEDARLAPLVRRLERAGT